MKDEDVPNSVRECFNRSESRLVCFFWLAPLLSGFLLSDFWAVLVRPARPLRQIKGLIS